jgi:hypothetical protein
MTKAETKAKGMKRLYLQQRQACFDYKKQYVCVKCGSSKSLQFDHIDQAQKSFEISQLIAKDRWPQLFTELDKCQVLCEQCHKLKTAAEASARKLAEGFTHGTSYAYGKRKCQCDICLAAKRNDYEERNASRRGGDARGPYNLPADHGTIKKYSRGCRCLECRAAHAAHVNSFR